MASKAKVYAVKQGNSTGIFNTWAECKTAIEGYPGAVYKSFESIDEAEAFLSGIDIVMNNDILPRVAEGKVVAFTDGSFDSGKKAYGSGVCIFAPPDTYVELCNIGKNEKYIDLRNVAGEIIAVMNAVDWAWKNGYDNLSIFHDYEGIGKWASGEWQAKTPLTNYYKHYIDDKSGIISIEFIKVSGHSNNKYNDRADKLAKSAVYENKIIRDLDGNSGYIISPVDEKNIDDLLAKLKDEYQGIDFFSAGNGNKKSWAVTFGAEKTQITLFNNIKMTVQGKKNNLFQIITTEVIETLQCGDFIQVLRNAYGISIDKVRVNDDFHNELPTVSHENLPTNIITLLKQAIINLNNPARNDTEFSMFVFPALRALEGILKYNLTKCGIAMQSYSFNMFEFSNGVYRLKAEFTGTISQDRITKLENCYNHLHNNRHTLFHFGIIIGGADANTRLLSSKAEADSIIRDTLKVIDENYIA